MTVQTYFVQGDKRRKVGGQTDHFRNHIFLIKKWCDGVSVWQLMYPPPMTVQPPPTYFVQGDKRRKVGGQTDHFRNHIFLIKKWCDGVSVWQLMYPPP